MRSSLHMVALVFVLLFLSIPLAPAPVLGDPALKFWFDASDDTTFDLGPSGSILGWKDKSGLGNHLIRSGGDPTRIENLQAGKAGVELHNADALQASGTYANGDPAPAEAHVVFIVCRTRENNGLIFAESGGLKLWSNLVGPDFVWRVATVSSCESFAEPRVPYVPHVFAVMRTPDPSQSTGQVVTKWHHGFSKESSHQICAPGPLYGLVLSNNAVGDPDDFRIGIEIFEVMGFTVPHADTISDAFIQTLSNELALKWNIPHAPVPELSLVIGDRATAEGDAGTRSLVAHVNLTRATAGTVTVDWATTDSTALSTDGDYVPASGTLTFLPGETSKPIAVTVNGDAIQEPDEVFKIDLANSSGAPIGDFRGIARIVNDDPKGYSCELYSTDGYVNAIAKSGNTLYIGGRFTRVTPASGCGVPLDATSGQPLSAPLVVKEAWGGVFAVAADGSGGWYIGGEFTHVGGVPRANLAHIRSDYTLDDSWDPGANGIVNGMALNGSTLYVCGNFESTGGQPRRFLAALDATTGDATSRNPDPDGNVHALAVSGTTVYAGGYFQRIGGQTRTFLAALDATTGAATAWDPGATGKVNALAVSGTIVYAGGFFHNIGGQSRRFIAALDATTAAATSFNAAAEYGVDALAVVGSTIYAGGRFRFIGGQARRCLAALNAMTGVATSWDPSPSISYGELSVKALAVSGTTVFVGGLFESIGGQQRKNIAAVDATTGMATSWDPSAGYTVFALAASGSTVYAGGLFRSIGGEPRKNIAALDVTTGAVTSWAPDANDYVTALAVSGTSVYAGGWFTTIGGQSRKHIAALDASTGAATSWDPNANSLVYDLALSGTTMYVGGYFTNIGGQPRNRIAALDATSGAATPWDPNVSSSGFGNPYVSALAVGETTVYAAGEFETIGGQPRNGLAALNATTGGVTSWNPNPDRRVYTLAVAGSTVYAGGVFSSIGGQARANLAALDATTGAATAWDPAPIDSWFGGSVSALAVNGTTVYVGGNFEAVGGVFRNNLAAINANTGFVPSWNPNANDRVSALLVDGSAVYAGGYFSSVANLPRVGIACLTQSPPVDVPPSGTIADAAFTRLAPNPARARAAIHFELPRPAHVRVSVFDVQGRLVARPVDEHRTAGRHVGEWDGQSRSGRATSGLYFVTFEAEGRVFTRRCVLLR